MQLYALSQKNPILASEAAKGKDYLCPECSSIVRVRGGPQRQLHFFHLKAAKSCKQHQKGEIHLKLQLHLQILLAEESPQLEHRFPEIDRIADVACLKSKRIFEIQYSPMSLEEAQSRTSDYESLGFQLIWLLHDHQFNKRKVSAAEAFLRTKICYFTDFDQHEAGMIYDQWENFQGNIRTFKGRPVPVNLKDPKPLIKQPNKPFSPWATIKGSYRALLHLLLKSASV